jgi:hypothetical protein
VGFGHLPPGNVLLSMASPGRPISSCAWVSSAAVSAVIAPQIGALFTPASSMTRAAPAHENTPEPKAAIAVTIAAMSFTRIAAMAT